MADPWDEPYSPGPNGFPGNDLSSSLIFPSPPGAPVKSPMQQWLVQQQQFIPQRAGLGAPDGWEKTPMGQSNDSHETKKEPANNSQSLLARLSTDAMTPSTASIGPSWGEEERQYTQSTGACAKELLPMGPASAVAHAGRPLPPHMYLHQDPRHRQMGPGPPINARLPPRPTHGDRDNVAKLDPVPKPGLTRDSGWSSRLPKPSENQVTPTDPVPVRQQEPLPRRRSDAPAPQLPAQGSDREDELLRNIVILSTSPKAPRSIKDSTQHKASASSEVSQWTKTQISAYWTILDTMKVLNGRVESRANQEIALQAVTKHFQTAKRCEEPNGKELTPVVLDVIYDLCEDRSPEVRMMGYKSLGTVSQAVDEYHFDRNIDILCQLLSNPCRPDELACLSQTILAHLEMSPKPTLRGMLYFVANVFVESEESMASVRTNILHILAIDATKFFEKTYRTIGDDEDASKHKGGRTALELEFLDMLGTIVLACTSKKDLSNAFAIANRFQATLWMSDIDVADHPQSSSLVRTRQAWIDRLAMRVMLAQGSLSQKDKATVLDILRDTPDLGAENGSIALETFICAVSQMQEYLVKPNLVEPDLGVRSQLCGWQIRSLGHEAQVATGSLLRTLSPPLRIILAQRVLDLVRDVQDTKVKDLQILVVTAMSSLVPSAWPSKARNLGLINDCISHLAGLEPLSCVLLKLTAVAKTSQFQTESSGPKTSLTSERHFQGKLRVLLTWASQLVQVLADIVEGRQGESTHGCQLPEEGSTYRLARAAVTNLVSCLDTLFTITSESGTDARADCAKQVDGVVSAAEGRLWIECLSDAESRKDWKDLDRYLLDALSKPSQAANGHGNAAQARPRAPTLLNREAPSTRRVPSAGTKRSADDDSDHPTATRRKVSAGVYEAPSRRDEGRQGPNDVMPFEQQRELPRSPTYPMQSMRGYSDNTRSDQAAGMHSAQGISIRGRGASASRGPDLYRGSSYGIPWSHWRPPSGHVGTRHIANAVNDGRSANRAYDERGAIHSANNRNSGWPETQDHQPREWW